MKVYEVNFDGLVGPTHNYAGLSFGNIASQTNVHSLSYPKMAALQGLEKMYTLHQLGIKQAVLPPHERPNLDALRASGFVGADDVIISMAWKNNPEILIAFSSAASMWAANAATMSPSSDCKDQKVHFTPANLTSNRHRMIETQQTTKVLRMIFNNPEHFVVHDPFKNEADLSDEGAANHTRFCSTYGEPGTHLFVFGRYGKMDNNFQPKKFPARQTFEASEAIAKQHGLDPGQVVYAQQNPEVVDQGVFHNDVISVGNQQLFFYHEKAFVNTPEVLEQLQQASHFDLLKLEVKESEITVTEAVATYLFNSQIVSTDDQKMILIAPSECSESSNISQYITNLCEDANNPIEEVLYLNVRESMRNGGGPACLRVRVVLTEEELSSMHQDVLFSEEKYEALKELVKARYREELTPSDLGDPDLLLETKETLNQISEILNLPTLYSFQ